LFAAPSLAHAECQVVVAAAAGVAARTASGLGVAALQAPSQVAQEVDAEAAAVVLEVVAA